MAISRRTGQPYFTDEEKAAALRNNNALECALSRGYQLERVGNVYRSKDHDSMIFRPDGRWWWNSQGKSGKAIDFLMAVENKTYTEAILELAGTSGLSVPQYKEIQQAAETRHAFILPERSDDYRRMFAYLCKTRGIDHALLSQLAKDNTVYEGITYAHFDIAGYDSAGQAWYTVKDKYKGKFSIPAQSMSLHPYDGSDKVREVSECIPSSTVQELATNKQTMLFHNVVMVGYDQIGIPAYASLRSMTGKYKVDVLGSQKECGFCINSDTSAPTVCVCESPIEAMSYWTMCKELGSPRINDAMLSLGGVSSSDSLKHFLNNHPAVHNIVLGLNIDTQKNGHKEEAGQRATERIKREFGDKYKIKVHTPVLNDWNDVLRDYKEHYTALLSPEYPENSISTPHRENNNREV